MPESTWRLVGASSTTRMLAVPATDLAGAAGPDTSRPAAAADGTGAREAKPFPSPASISDFSNFMKGSLRDARNMVKGLPGRIDQGAFGIQTVRPGGAAPGPGGDR